ncbi:F0F1 ATP synthase subunit A [Paenibacillus polysaccharolyticus]|uniref:ATP synthase subunit a n=3 Tax=Paenibacillus TaxID=44249 RepID=A0A5M9WVA7_PAEAM|nr:MULTISPECIES: F0F1 ATP synthase subunit A [Paenibacillus]MDP9699911.1 F-type H+-transporting ATPase subunit a [Paenibacillus intestini]KAA8785531.1 F0F1 ATP synthase subunit A [Paenibacillus amylolyticus]MBY0206755.1 F0F1 ATP synthase subunit A [Paenibacillus cucumis (ex Kampfer et al. 2016)]MCM3134897.1 F0F1 ATP synthase subunit A [Paenibacillus polysaccharolyticus]MCP1137406.1 F0F1 ATP synthase subunit A [Paenibacillus polysaccharolyticus]
MHEAPVIMLGGFHLDLSVLLMLIVTSAIVFIFAIIATRNLSVDNPGKLQNFMEWAVEFVRNLISSTMDMKKGKHFISLALTMILFIFVGNMLGLPFQAVTDVKDVNAATVFGKPIVTAVEAYEKAHAKDPEAHPHIELAWFKSPTADLSVTMGLALVAFLVAHGLGLFKNTRGYLKHYVQPYALFLPINIIETASKLLTHGMRLFANIFAGEVLIATILKLTSFKVLGAIFAIPLLAVWQGFSIFIGGIQAFVFVILMMVYISQTIETHEEH